VAAVIDAAIVPTRHMNVAVETTSGLNLGRTVIDVHGRTGRAANVDVGVDLDVERFWNLVVGALSRYGAPAAG
jgi:purine nucleosidase/pyrimidine-specific ribonucleoside hydrolase